MKLFRIDDAARRLGLPIPVLKSLEGEGQLRPRERIGDTSYYEQSELDRLIQELHTKLQRASWREMELRVEKLEERVALLERQLEEHRTEGATRFI